MAFRFASGFPLYLFPLRLRLREKRMPLQSLTQSAPDPKAPSESRNPRMRRVNDPYETDAHWRCKLIMNYELWIVPLINKVYSNSKKLAAFRHFWSSGIPYFRIPGFPFMKSPSEPRRFFVKSSGFVIFSRLSCPKNVTKSVENRVFHRKNVENRGKTSL